MMNIFSSWFASLRSPAILNSQLSNLFHCFDLFPLVLSEKRISGSISAFLPAAEAFSGWGLVNVLCSYTRKINMNCHENKTMKCSTSDIIKIDDKWSIRRLMLAGGGITP